MQYDGGNIDRVAVGAYSRGKMCKVVDLCLGDNLFDTCSAVIPDLTDYVVLPDPK